MSKNVDVDVIRQEHKDKIETLALLRRRVAELETDTKEFVSTAIFKLERELNAHKDDQEHIDKKDLEKDQGFCSGLRHALRVLRGNDLADAVAYAKSELDIFEKNNAMFLAR